MGYLILALYCVPVLHALSYFGEIEEEVRAAKPLNPGFALAGQAAQIAFWPIFMLLDTYNNWNEIDE